MDNRTSTQKAQGVAWNKYQKMARAKSSDVYSEIKPSILIESCINEILQIWFPK